MTDVYMKNVHINIYMFRLIYKYMDTCGFLCMHMYMHAHLSCMFMHAYTYIAPIMKYCTCALTCIHAYTQIYVQISTYIDACILFTI